MTIKGYIDMIRGEFFDLYIETWSACQDSRVRLFGIIFFGGLLVSVLLYPHVSPGDSFAYVWMGFSNASSLVSLCYEIKIRRDRTRRMIVSETQESLTDEFLRKMNDKDN